MENYEKKYKEVLEKAKALYKASEPMSGCNVILEILFPELKESEDEKVRKELIKHLKELSDWKEDEVIPVKNPSYYRQWASWLEKQELKSNPYSGVSFSYNGNVWGMCARDNGVDILFNKKLIEHISGEKQGEQTHANWSGDEQIRKSLIRNFTNQHSSNFPTVDGFTREQILSWLERQGEHANFLSKIQVGDKVTRNENGVLVNLSQLERVAKPRKKQGDHAIYNVPAREVILAIWDLGNEWKELTGGSISTEYDTQLNYIQKHWHESEYYLRAMQNEQKLIEEYKPEGSDFEVFPINPGTQLY